jgi:hypothetical protein
MMFFKVAKEIAEMITAVVAAIIVIMSCVKEIPILWRFLTGIKPTIKSFFQGTVDIGGKRVRFFKGLKLKKERTMRITNAIAPDSELEEVLVLDKNALFDIISNSRAFKTIQMRKK